MEQLTYLLKFEDLTPAEASDYADELRNSLLNVGEDIQVQTTRDNQHAQDFGTTLVLVFGTPVAVKVVDGLSNWLQKRRSAKITITTPDGTIILENITSENAMKLAERMLPHK
jgi:hypothetical protein